MSGMHHEHIFYTFLVELDDGDEAEIEAYSEASAIQYAKERGYKPTGNVECAEEDTRRADELNRSLADIGSTYFPTAF